MKYIFLIIIYISGMFAGDTFYDKNTKLTWQDVENKKKYKYKSEVFSTGALEYCKNLELHNYKNWRLPTVKELITIVDISKHSPAIIDELKHVNYGKYAYFTSNTNALTTKNFYGQIVYFKDGSIDISHKLLEISGYVRCVRTGKGF